MKAKHGFFTSLKCRECGRHYPKEALHVCEFCFGPLEVDYDYDLIKTVLTRDKIAVAAHDDVAVSRAVTDGGRTDNRLSRSVSHHWSGRIAWQSGLGLREVWVKNDTVNYPTLSFKDRVVSVGLSRARELGFEVVACASTGNLANSVAANAASGGLKSYVFIPADLETGKVLGSLVYGTNVIGIRGTYDQVNRLCSEIAGKFGWAFVNVNIRPYYAEGSKAMGYEIAEQLGWRLPDHVVVPMAGGSLITKIHKSFREFVTLGLVEEHLCSIHGAQAEGCAPIVNAMKAGADIIKPVNRPQTIVKSLAIGNPADGFYSIQTMRQTGGWAENPNDEEVVAGIRLLAETEGIFAETAGGMTVAATQRLVECGPDQAGRIAGVVHYGPWAEDAGSSERQMWRGARDRAASARVFSLVGREELIRRRRNDHADKCADSDAVAEIDEGQGHRASLGRDDPGHH